MFTEKMPVLLAEYEKLPATGKSDQFLAGSVFDSPGKTVAVTRSHRQMATMHHPL